MFVSLYTSRSVTVSAYITVKLISYHVNVSYGVKLLSFSCFSSMLNPMFAGSLASCSQYLRIWLNLQTLSFLLLNTFAHKHNAEHPTVLLKCLLFIQPPLLTPSPNLPTYHQNYTTDHVSEGCCLSAPWMKKPLTIKPMVDQWHHTPAFTHTWKSKSVLCTPASSVWLSANGPKCVW